MENSIHNSRNFWKEIRRFTNKLKVSNNIHLEEWYHYFRSLFTTDNLIERNNETEEQIENNSLLNDIETGIFILPIEDDEIVTAVKGFNIRKAFAGDIKPQQIKFGMPALLPYLRMLFNRIYFSGTFPVNWSRILLIPLYKKGNINDPSNYRGIALMEILSKIYISILTKRLTFYVEAYEKLTESQAGFRNGYSTVDNAFALYSIVTKYFNLRRKAVYVAFIDFEKVFDSFDRPILYDILHKNGVTGTLFTAIQAIYNNVKACVKSPEGISDEFTCPIGLRQGRR